ncbi:hypothetical protein AcV5_003023 [Taiwanofungus camphoratus]|nr:hypothetical protein AcV5_003023 [Antrodia cinnamomea]
MSSTSSATVFSSTATPSSHVKAHRRRPGTGMAIHVDILLLCVLGAFILLALPQAIARFRSRSEWTDGYLFRSIRRKRNSGGHSPSGSRDEVSHGSDGVDEMNIEKLDGVSRGSDSDIDQKESTSECGAVDGVQSTKLPIHIPAWSTILPRLHSVIGLTIRPGYTVGKIILLLAYLGLLLYTGLLIMNPFKDPLWAGMVGTMQIPVVYVTATKNNVVGELIGKGYEKLNYLHRFAGRFVVLAVNVHAIGYFFYWIREGVITEHLKTYVKWGIVSLVSMDVLFAFSVSVIREMHYQFFYVSHVIAAVIMLVSAYLHVYQITPYVAAAVGVYGLDRLLRVLKGRIVTAQLSALPELEMARIEVPKINAGWRAGQHVRLKVLSTRMGWYGWFESHPFTIASVGEGHDGEGLVLLCKEAGNWTSKLLKLAQGGQRGEAGDTRKDVKILLDGPYGGPGHSIVSSFSGAMIVAGGSGVSYAMATVEDLLRKGLEGTSRVGVIELVWSVRNPAALIPLMPLFFDFLKQSKAARTSVTISVFYTRALEYEDALKPFQSLPRGLTLSPGRPRLPRILEGVVDRTSALDEAGGRPSDSRLTGVVIGVCGPIALSEEAGKAIRSIPAEKFKAVGGIELHEEIFAW